MPKGFGIGALEDDDDDQGMFVYIC